MIDRCKYIFDQINHLSFCPINAMNYVGVHSVQKHLLLVVIELSVQYCCAYVLHVHVAVSHEQELACWQ